MKQRLSTYLQKNKSSVKSWNLSDTVHNVFRLLTFISSCTPDKSIVYLSFHRATSIAQQEGIHIPPTHFYQAIDELIDMNVIIRIEFKC